MSAEIGREASDNQPPRGVIDVIMGRFIIRPSRRITSADLYQTESRFPREGVALPEELTTPQKMQELGLPEKATRFVREQYKEADV